MRLFSFSTMFFIDFISCPARTRLLFDFVAYFYRGGSRTLFLPRNLGTRFSQSLSPFYCGGSSLSMFITFQDRHFRVLILKLDAFSLSLAAKPTVFLLFSSNLDLGSLSLSILMTLGHSMGSIILMSTLSSISLVRPSTVSSKSAKQDFSRRAAALGRWVGSIFRQRAMKSLRFLEYLLGISSYLPAVMAWKSPGKSSALKGGASVHISQMMQPRAQMSHLLSYLRPFQISGLVQQGVPVWVEAKPLSVILEMLRSPILATPSTKKTFAHFRSRCIILWSCRPFRPFSSWCADFQMKSSSKPEGWAVSRRVLILPSRSPPSAYSMTMQSDCSSGTQKEPLQEITQGMLMEARRRISLRAASFSFCLALASSMDLRAQYFLSSLLRMSCTRPQLPVPSSFITSKSFIFSCSLFSILQKNINYSPHQQIADSKAVNCKISLVDNFYTLRRR